MSSWTAPTELSKNTIPPLSKGEREILYGFAMKMGPKKINLDELIRYLEDSLKPADIDPVMEK